MATKRTGKQAWPILRRYEGEHLLRVALPLGGIGTGTVSLGGRGQLRDWEVGHRPAKGFQPAHTFFALYAKPAGGPAVARALEGAILPVEFEGASGCTTPNHGLPRFRKCVFETAYPLAVVRLSDPDVPVEVRLEAFNPFVPVDAEASGIPIAILRYRLRNRTSKKVSASVCGNLQNFIGTQGGGTVSKPNVNEFRVSSTGWRGLAFSCPGLSSVYPKWGTLALTTDAKTVTYRTAWRQGGWGWTLVDYWDDFSSDGKLEEVSRHEEDQTPMGSLAAQVEIPPRGERVVTFLLCWHFPNRPGWHEPPSSESNSNWGHPVPFVRILDVSRLLPLNGTLAQWNLPADPAEMGFERREFSGDFCNMHETIQRGGKEERCLVFRHRFSCAEPMRINLALGYDGPVKVWMDGQPVYHDPAGRNPAIADSVRIPLEVQAGEHVVHVALGNNGGKAWGIFLRYERTDVPLSVLQSDDRSVPLPEFEKPAVSASKEGDQVGNYYATRYADAWDVMEKTVPKLSELEARTVRFVEAFCKSDLPLEVKEAALFNLSTLRSQTCFRIASGHLMAWEGCQDTVGCCFGSCTHVWNYEPATAHLFGDLARTMREVEFRYSLLENGLMGFRAELPLSRAATFGKAAADGQLGCILKIYREWQLSGDEAWLRDLWPKVRRAVEFCWIPRGWDGDQDGVMEGCQHNTMDVEYYGPNPQMQFWYLAALRAAEEMARFVGENDFADRCRRLFQQGSAWTDAHLFNGEYYEHEIRPPSDPSKVAPGLQVGMGAKDPAHPTGQLGAGCLVDQLVGQHMAHLCGLGYLADSRKIRRTLQSIWKYNRRSPLYGHFNHLRSFALSDESALLMASYPRGRRPVEPFPYFNEVMTGFEYTAAAHMIYEGQEKTGLQVIADIRARYDGKRRNPFDEAECGHHYGRAMASWGALLTLTGFRYSAVTQTLRFAARQGRHFWSTGYAWGTCGIRSDARRRQWTVELEVYEGEIRLSVVGLEGVGDVPVQTHQNPLKGGACLVVTVPMKTRRG